MKLHPRLVLFLLGCPGLLPMTAVVLILCSVVSAAQPDATLEYRVKAAFLYNFTRFVRWPESASGRGKAPIVLAVLGSDPFGSTLEETIAGKTVNGRPLVVTRLASLDGIPRGGVLFVSSSERARVPQIVAMAAGAGILTVSDMEGFARAGGMIGFVTMEGKIHMEINPAAASQAGIEISSKLLSLSTVVSSGGRKGGA
jgi:hypothetical protein